MSASEGVPESWKSSTSAPKLAPNERVPYMNKASNLVFPNCTDIYPKYQLKASCRLRSGGPLSPDLERYDADQHQCNTKPLGRGEDLACELLRHDGGGGWP